MGPELMLFHQRMIMLQIVDTQWKDHLYSLDHLKEGIGLRGYGQRDPLVEYKKESFQMFQALMDRIDEEILRWIFLYQPVESRRELALRRGSDEPPLAAAREPAAPARAAAREREPELALAGARATPRNLSFNDPSASPGGVRQGRRSRERRRAATDEVQTVRREGQEGGTERSVSLREREEVQEVPWGELNARGPVAGSADLRRRAARPPEVRRPALRGGRLHAPHAHDRRSRLPSSPRPWTRSPRRRSPSPWPRRAASGSSTRTCRSRRRPRRWTRSSAPSPG